MLGGGTIVLTGLRNAEALLGLTACARLCTTPRGGPDSQAAVIPAPKRPPSCLTRSLIEAPRSPSAARQLGDIFLERLGGQLQPFDRRQVGEDRLGELLHREPALDRQGRRLDAVGALRRQDVRAEQLAGAGRRCRSV